MIDMDSISATVSSLQTAGNMVKSFLDMKSLADVQAKVIDLQSIILSAQSSALSANSEQFSMLDEIRALKEKIADIEAWEAEKQRYELKTIAPGSFVYALKPEAQGTEPPHQICAACYQKGKKFILQRGSLSGLGASQYLICPEFQQKVTAPLVF